MEKKLCVRCGTKLFTTTINKRCCPNCGVIEENQDVEKFDGKLSKYIG